ncbi:MAG: polysaccharide biosynthesis C-terminal domain-containing protein, partial [Anaerolineales bacterium]|nr:polysaccharide biosynthesis C-terminal domain-containing protein [Anaerolineales bacterium]
YALVRFLATKVDKAQIREEYYSALALVLISGLVIFAFLFFFADSIAGAFFGGATRIVQITGLIVLVWALDAICLNLFRTFRQMKLYAVLAIGEVVASLGVVTYLVLTGHGLLSAVLTILIVRAVVLVVASILVWYQIGIAWPRFTKVREYLRFCLPTVPASITGWVVPFSDRSIIMNRLGPELQGVYTGAYLIGNIPYMITGLLSFVLLPALSKLYDEDRMSEVKTHLSYTLKYFVAFTIPFTLGAALLGKQILNITSPNIATQGYFIVPLIALSTMILGICVIVEHILVLVKKTRIVGITWAVAAVVNLAINIIVIPRIGILGAAISTLAAYSLALGIVVYYSFKEFRFSIDWRFVIKSLAASIVMSLIIWGIAPQTNAQTILTVVAGVVVYAALLISLKGFSRAEFRFFRELLKLR